MQAQRFGGESAQLLWRSLHPTSAAAGILAAVLGGACLMLLGRSSALSHWIGPAWSCIAFAIVSRVALDALHSGEMGSLVRGRGADPRALFEALGRVLLINLCWLIPASIILSGGPKQTVPGLGVPPQVGIIAPLALLLPPTLVVVALGARSWAGMFQREHWNRLFGGRVADLLQLYSTYLGAILATGLVIWSAIFGMAAGRPKLLLVLSLAALGYQLGVGLLLLGRLIGAYLRSAGEGLDEFESLDTDPLPSFDDGPADFEPATPVQPKSSPVETPVAPRPDISKASMPVNGGTPSRTHQLSESEAGDSLVVRLRQLERLAQEDPGQALAQLTELKESRGPHPMILARLAILERSMGLASAHDAAVGAVQLARQTGNLGILAELELAFGEDSPSIGIDESDWLKIASSHLLLGREDEAVQLYTRTLAGNAESVPAVKGLLKVAESREKNERDPEGAMHVYGVILRLAPEHPFAEFAERGRTALERRLLRSL